MLTIVIPNRNRSLTTVQRTLSSIAPQCGQGVSVVLVDYGSEVSYQKKLQLLVNTFENITVVMCPTQGQLWQKTRAINIALKQCDTTYFLVADMDMIFHPEFVQKALAMSSLEKIIYFQVGIMTQEESSLKKEYNDYQIKFKTNLEATGITLFPTKILKSMNGFDEFYHGWGAEDTDVHVRLGNAGYDVLFYEKECLFLHQWHPKHYRSTKSTAPFHPLLEKINQSYLRYTKTSGKTVANNNMSWGMLPLREAYKQLQHPSLEFNIYATQEDVDSFLAQLISGALKTSLCVEFKTHPNAGSLKEIFKKALGKRIPRYLKMRTVNEAVLSTVINELRNAPYRYTFDHKAGYIRLDINLREMS